MGDISIEIIKSIFGENGWLLPAIVIAVSIFVVQYIRGIKLPRYLRCGAIICIVAIAAFVEAFLLKCSSYHDIVMLKYAIMGISTVLLASALVFLAHMYISSEKQLRFVIKNANYDGNIIEAWKKLQEIRKSRLTTRQIKKY